MIGNPFGFFGVTYCINLDTRPDRWVSVYDEFVRVGILDIVERFAGIVPEASEPSIWGCGLSHLAIIREAERRKLENVLVLEDDVRFVNQPVEVLNRALEQLSGLEWDVFYLGATTHEPLEKVSTNLVRIKSCHATHAIAYHRRIYDFILQNVNPQQYYDIWLRYSVQPVFNCYGTNPLIATQSAGYSDIQKGCVDYAFIENDFRINTAHIR